MEPERAWRRRGIGFLRYSWWSNGEGAQLPESRRNAARPQQRLAGLAIPVSPVRPGIACSVPNNRGDGPPPYCGRTRR
jgi:hypothetical protein